MQETAVSTKKKPKSEAKVEAAPDPRAPLPPTAANLQATVAELEQVLADLPPPVLAADQPPPQLDLVEAMLHIYFADGLPCGYGQEARRRIGEGFVDRNEFRVTEAFEVEDLLRDLEIPHLFERCLAVRDSVAQVYNDQNGVNLGFLRDAGVGDRNTFFQRVPALQPHVVTFLGNLLTIEELCFSDKSTLRAQQRLGLDPKDAAANKFLDRVRALLKPYGHLPLDVGAHLPSRKPNLAHPLSPACILVRLAPGGKRR
ncbi:MAG: hypothetical protein KF830_02335 [Planctomycetes bacterium]|nr:hypothetical protein [Planctomycetota bacterium]